MSESLFLSMSQLVQRGHSAPSADNSQPWHFYWDGNRLYLNFDESRVGNRTFPPSSPATLLAMGGAVENMSLAAAEAGWSLEVELFPERHPGSICYAALDPGKTDQRVLAPNEPSIRDRHTNRFPYQRTPIKKTLLTEVAGFSEGNARLTCFSDRTSIKHLAKLVEMASQIRFQTRELQEWLGSSLRFTPNEARRGDGLDVDTLALPPGGKYFLKFISRWKNLQAMNKIGGYRFLAKIEARPLALAPAVIAVAAPLGKIGALEAGRLLTRVWTRLNRAGVAVHPYYVVADQLFRLREDKVPPKLRHHALLLNERLQDRLDLAKGEAHYMLLRIGYPTREAPRSRRLPREAVFTDLTARR